MDNGALRGTENLGPEQLAERLRSVIAQGRAALQAEHGYARSNPVTGAAIADEDQFTLDKLLVERLYAKRSRDFAKADEIRAQLQSAGVRVDDRESSYGFQPPRGARADPNVMPTEHGYTRQDDGTVPVAPADQVTLDALLLERLVAKKQRDFEKADRLRDALKEAGVFVQDHENTYRVVDRSKTKLSQREPEAMPTHHGYTRMDDGVVPVAPGDQITLDALLLERLIAKKQRDFTRADQLRDTLKAAGVHCDDKGNTYRVVPPCAPPQQAMPRAMPAHHRYTRMDDGMVPVAPADQMLLEQLLYQRACAKIQRNYMLCDQLREQLKAAGVHLDDKSLTYRVVPPRAARVPGGMGQAMPTHHGYTRVDDGFVPVLPAGQVQLDNLLLQRVIAKRQRNFPLADQLREQLKEGGVHCDDGGLTYRVVDPRKKQAYGGGGQRAPRELPTQHDYTRDDDGAVVIDAANQATLDQMILQRVHAKMTRDFDTSDQLRDQLKAAGCHMNDGDRTYRVVDINKPRGPQMPTEHGYTRDDDGSVLVPPDQQTTLDALLLERVCAKRRREFDTADTLRDQLSAAGVFCDDAARTYRVGVPGTADTSRGARSSSGREEKPWTRDVNDDSGVPLAPGDEAMLIERLTSRGQAKRIRDYTTSDAIMDELREVAKSCACLVRVDDRERTFRFESMRARGPTMPTEHGYTRTDDGSIAVTAADQQNLDEMLLGRICAKRRRDFEVADQLRDQLSAVGVYCNDGAQTYRVGVPGENTRPQRGSQMPTEHGYTRTDDGSIIVSAEDQQNIDEMLLERICAKRRQDFECADKLRDQLGMVGVFCDDGEQSYRVSDPKSEANRDRRQSRSEEYTRSDDGSVSLSTADQEKIETIIKERIQAKRRREFGMADKLRGELTEMGVFCDDRANTYSVRPPSAIHGFKRDPNDDGDDKVELSKVDEDEMHKQMIARNEARRSRDYDTADAIREDLREKFGVELNQQQQLYRIVPPREGRGGMFSQRSRSRSRSRSRARDD